MIAKDELRSQVRGKLDEIIAGVNGALTGSESLAALRPTLERNGRGGKIPHWFNVLSTSGTLPNLDGKSIGSVVEMLLIAELESHTFHSLQIPPLRVNPARGVDLPDLDLSIKSPSENYCTSEPFFSAYERLYGSEYDALVLLTDYQTAKANPPLKLQIIKWRYVKRTQLADRGLCQIAKKHRQPLIDDSEGRAQRLFRFLAYVNQSDWLGRRLVRVIDEMDNEDAVRQLVAESVADFKKTNAKRDQKGRELIPESGLAALLAILKASPLILAVVDAADNWIAENLKEAGRLPNENEWNRLKSGPLDGKIGMSPALQWRYNFGPLFGVSDDSGLLADSK
jgi:hypothetical protein